MAGRILFLLCSILAGIATTGKAYAEKRVALVVGIDTYDNLGTDQQLKKARNDARAMALALVDLKFDVIAKDDLTRSTFNATWVEFSVQAIAGGYGCVLLRRPRHRTRRPKLPAA